MTRRRCTDDCLQLRVSVLKDTLASGMKMGMWKWTTREGHSCRWELSSRDGMQFFWLDHETLNHGRQRYGIQYLWKQTPLGTRRLYFRCPSVACQRDITTLYWPLGGQYFLCRHCWGLRYRSQQERSIGPSGMDLLEELEQQDMSTRKGRRRAAELTQQLEELYRELEPLAASIRVSTLLRKVRARHPELWRRRPGRPSPKKWRAAARAARAAARAADRAARPKLPPGRPKQKREYARRKPFVLSERKSDMQAYCPKCRDRRELVQDKRVTFRNGRLAMQGTCRECGTKMARIVK